MTNTRESPANRVVVLDVVGLEPEHVADGAVPNLAAFLDDGVVSKQRPAFPALTVPAQTTLATGQPPGTHGDVASGEYDRAADTVTFWDRDRGNRERLWETVTEDTDRTTGVLFCQHLIGTAADVAVTPSPVEDENDDLIEMDCWTNPDGFYDDLYEEYGHFPLHSYWGPGASEESTEWILDAARESVTRFDPDLLWVYVPHLDYAGLRAGPRSAEIGAALETVDGLIDGFLDFLRADDRWAETVVAVVSEYGFHRVDRPVFPNRALVDSGLIATGESGDVDLGRSAAFAMVDHQVAHVYADDAALSTAKNALASLDGVDAVLGEDGKRERDVAHPHAGDIVLVADADAWFQYYWWDDPGDAPPYATDVDIHAKPGFDPCELFFGDDGLVSLDPSKVGGSHGRVDDETWAILAVGGPAASGLSMRETVDARDVAPILADLLGTDAPVG